MLTRKTIIASALLTMTIGTGAANAAWHDLGWGTLSTWYSSTGDAYHQSSRDRRTDGHCVYAVSNSLYGGGPIYHPWSCYSSMNTRHYVGGNISSAKLCRTGGSTCGAWKRH